MSNEPVICVAIDGPAASGKSTVARGAAKKLGFNYVDSGSFYRGLTWKCMRDSVDSGSPPDVLVLLARVQWDLSLREGQVVYSIDSEEPGEQLKSKPVQERVSEIAAIPEVRAYIVAKLREAAMFGSLVMEGRDIGTVVFPDTPHKFYLDADPEERARRRFKELEKSGAYDDAKQVLNSLQKRDHKDSTRKTAPLQIALGARVIDSTSMDADAVIELVVKQVAATRP
jgi:cytidylate kinase